MFKPILDSVPSEFEIGGDGRPTVTIPLAASPDGNQWVALEVRLWPAFWRGVASHEFKFAIVHFDETDGGPAVIFDRNMASGYLENVRELVMPCVCAAAQTLILSVRPDVIYRATYLTRPPPKSLSKHQMITKLIESMGYYVAQSETDGQGRLFWVMIKQGQ